MPWPVRSLTNAVASMTPTCSAIGGTVLRRCTTMAGSRRAVVQRRSTRRNWASPLRKAYAMYGYMISSTRLAAGYARQVFRWKHGRCYSGTPQCDITSHYSAPELAELIEAAGRVSERVNDFE